MVPLQFGQITRPSFDHLFVKVDRFAAVRAGHFDEIVLVETAVEFVQLVVDAVDAVRKIVNGFVLLFQRFGNRAQHVDNAAQQFVGSFFLQRTAVGQTVEIGLFQKYNSWVFPPADPKRAAFDS